MKDFSLVVLTGYSGAGKSTASNVLEDLGYYTVDNMPLSIVEKFVQIMFDFNSELNKAVLVIDVRSRDIAKALEIITMLKEKYGAVVIFLSSSDESLMRRYKETRRKHPLGESLLESIEREKSILDGIKGISDLVVDTSSYSVHDLAKFLEDYFRTEDIGKVHLTVQSFGFKYGLPAESDLVLDVRFLKNPHFVDELRSRTGLENDVAEYVFSDYRTKQFLRKIKPLLMFLIPNYIREGKKFLTLSIGCTGGKHRSVAIAQFIGEYLNKKTNNKIMIKHRDISRG